MTGALYVYRNLKTKLWCLGERPRSSAAWPQVASLVLREVRFRCGSTAYQRRIYEATGKLHRSVCAFAVGVPAAGLPALGTRHRVSYHPLEGYFYLSATPSVRITGAEYVGFGADGAFAVNPERGAP
jgi:hypothetical protein